MRRVTWLVLLGGVCVGCGKKDEPPVPNVAIDNGTPMPGEPKVVILPSDPQAGKVGALEFAKLWNPKDDAKTDAETLVKELMAQRHFAKHQTEYLATATVGSLVAVPQGGMHGLVVPAALAAAYPDVAKKMETNWTDRLVDASTLNIPTLDFSTSGTGGASVRVLVLRVKDGTDDELRIRFGEYLTRLEEAMKGTGVVTMAHQRGGIRLTGSLSDIRYETQSRTRTGYVRSVLVRKYDENDIEFKAMMMGDAAKDDGGALVKAVMTADHGPYLVVTLREQRQ